MGSRVAMAGSIAIHVAAACALVLLTGERGDEAPPRDARVETIEPSIVQLVDLEVKGGGGGGGAATPAPTAAPKSERIATRSPTRMPRVSELRTVKAELGEVTFEPPIGAAVDGDARSDGSGNSKGGGNGNGNGSGNGNGNGNGIGLGIGNAGLSPRDVVPPPAPKASKARPPKLIYPTREHAVDDEGELFIARVTVDTDGFVVGARLLKGQGNHRDRDASSLIFRFRYAPALDEDGRPIKATIDQPFLVQ